MLLSRDEKIRYTPAENSGRWSTERGNSLCAPKSEQSRAILAEKGLDGIQYHDGEPDFSPLSESTVQIGNMTSERHSSGVPYRDGKNTTYTHFNEDGTIDRYHKADPNSMSDLMSKYDKPGNFEQADILTAQNWSAEGRDGHKWTAKDVADYREANGLTWHERGDGTTMDMIPREINADFDHAGGVAEIKERDRIIAEENEKNPEYANTEEFDWDSLSDEELDAALAQQEQDWYSYGTGDSEAGAAGADTNAGTDNPPPTLDKDDDVNQINQPNNDPVATPPDESHAPETEESSMEDLVPLSPGAQEAPQKDHTEEQEESEMLADETAHPESGSFSEDDTIAQAPSNADEESNEEQGMEALTEAPPQEMADTQPKQEAEEEQEADMAELAEQDEAQEQADSHSQNTPEQDNDQDHGMNT